MDAKISSQNQNNELQVSTTLYHQFKLPNDWVVVRRCRSKRGNRRSHNDKVGKTWVLFRGPGCGEQQGISPNLVSNIIVQTTISTLLELPQFLMYHYEPGTGQRFCSLISIQKHLSGETSKSAKPGNKKNHYFEPETGKRFRSPRSVEKYLTEGKEHLDTLEALKAGDNFIPSKSSSSQKEHVSRKKVETSMLDPSSIPAKIKWVLSGPGGIVWNPFMDDSLVPEFIKQKWSETFVFSIIDRR